MTRGAEEKIANPFRRGGHSGGSGPEAGDVRALPLRPLTGFEEEYLEAALALDLPDAVQGGPDAAAPNTAELCNELLARCCVAPGESPAPLREQIDRLTVAERDLELIRLRRISLGDKIEGTVACPQCGEMIELDFDLSELPLPGERPPRRLACTLEDGREARLRVPTAGDQAALAGHSAATSSEQRTWLLARVLESLQGESGPFTHDAVRAMPVSVTRALERSLEEALPDFNLDMQVSCHACGHDFLSPFDVQSFFLPR